MKKIIIIDDEPLARSVISEYLKSYQNIHIAAECNDGFEGLKSIAQHHPDLIFLDIQMPKINGFEMLELLSSLPAVIFTTAFDEYAIKAFEANAVDYLLKPFSQERFDMAIQKLITKSEHSNASADVLPIQRLIESSEKHPEEKNRIVIKNGAEIRIIPVDDVLYVEAYDDYVKIITEKDTFLKKKTMNYYENTLSAKQFLRIHRSYIINIQQLTKIESLEKNSYIAILKNGKRIPVSRNNYGKLKEVLGW